MSKKTEYEEHILHTMNKLDVTLLEAMVIDLYQNGVEVSSTISVTDYLESMLNKDMDKVNFFSRVLNGSFPDLEINK
jgi:hypothetical protein